MSTKHRWKVRLHLDLTDEMIDVLDDYGSQFILRERTNIWKERAWLCSDSWGDTRPPAEMNPDDKGRVYVGHTQLVGACDLLFRKYPDTRAAGYMRDALCREDAGFIDAEAADVIWQLATYGDIVFG